MPSFDFDPRDLDGLRDFLRSGRARLRQQLRLSPADLPEVHVVLGNESADMDSFVSAIVRAYHLSLGQDAIYLPFIAITREELALRRDIEYLLASLGIPADDLSFIDDEYTLDTIHQHAQLRLHLVDHNELNPDLAHLSAYVVDIVDHHADTQRYPDLPSKLIQTIGSCTTLVANEFFKTHTAAPALACLMLAPVLLDTDNLKSREKTTEQDRELCIRLSSVMGDKLPPEFYETLQINKADVSNFSRRMRLLKDFKKSRVDSVLFGMSSLGASEGFWIENQEEMLPDLHRLSTEKSLDFLLLLMPYHDEKRQPQRKILAYSRSPDTLQTFNDLAKDNAFLKELFIPGEESAHICFYRTEKFVSRKELEPNIRVIAANDRFIRPRSSG